MPAILRVVACVLLFVPLGPAQAALPTCDPETQTCNTVCTTGDTRPCTTTDGCVGLQQCQSGQWPRDDDSCLPTAAPQACVNNECGAGGYRQCSLAGEMGPCMPASVQQLDACNNGCDENHDGQADEGCAGQETFDYCEPNGSGGYTRWTCGCGDGLNVGYCLGSADPQESCNSPTGCLKAPAFATSGANQIGGNFRCCVSSLSCENANSGYVEGAFRCSTSLSQRFECSPAASDPSCQDSNQCADMCSAPRPAINHSTGELSGHSASCLPDKRSVCNAAQGGLSSGGLGTMEQIETHYEYGPDCVDGTTQSTTFGYTIITRCLHALPPLGGGSARTSIQQGGGARSGGAGGHNGNPAPAPELNQCGPSPGTGIAGSALSSI